MWTRRLGAAAVGCMLVAAWAARAQDKVVLPGAVNKAIHDYVFCVGSKAEESMNSSDPSEALIDRAMAFCTDRRDLLRDEFMRPPLSKSRQEADGAAGYMTDSLRPKMIRTLKQARGGL